MTDLQIIQSLQGILDRDLEVMNQAIEVTTSDGPAAGIELIADYLNDNDGLDEELADNTPDNWLTQWKVTRA